MSSLKTKMAAKQLEQVEELVASTKPTSKRELARLEAERLAVEAALEQTQTEGDGPPVPEVQLAEVEATPAEQPSEEAQPGADSLSVGEVAQAEAAPSAAQPARKRAAEPTIVREPARQREVVPARLPRAKTPNSGGQLWRNYVTPPAARGTSVNICRLNIPVSESIQLFLAQADYELKQERSRWVVNRNSVVTAAAESFLADPQGWEEQYLAARHQEQPSPKALQGRVTPELFDDIELARYTPAGKRPVGPVLSFIVRQLLGIPDEG